MVKPEIVVRNYGVYFDGLMIGLCYSVGLGLISVKMDDERLRTDRKFAGQQEVFKYVDNHSIWNEPMQLSITKVERYETSDGQIHTSEAAAKAWVIAKEMHQSGQFAKSSAGEFGHTCKVLEWVLTHHNVVFPNENY